MSETSEAAATVLSVSCEQRIYPPYDAFHATPSPMLWRRATIETPEGRAVFEQTDYGHPGRLNDWEPRGIAVALAPRLQELRAALDALTRLLV